MWTDDGLELLRKALDTLHVAIGHARLYGARHRETLGAVERALVELSPLLEQHGVIELGSSPDGLTWRGRVVRPEDEEMPGLGCTLHREGIAHLSLVHGVDTVELGRLLDVLRINFELPEYEEETLDSLLWQADLQHVGFQAVSALVEAETLSHDLVAAPPIFDARSAVEALTKRKPSGGPRQFGDDALHQAVARSQLAGLGGDDAARADLDADQWRRHFVEEGHEDEDALRGLRAELEASSPSVLAARVAQLCLQAVLAERVEMPPDRAMILAQQAAEEVLRSGDPTAMLDLLDATAAVLQSPTAAGARHAPAVRDYLARAVPPSRITRLLMDESTDLGRDPEAVAALVERLPEAALLSVLEAASKEGHSPRGREVLGVLGAVAGARVGGWLAGALQQPADRALPAIALARSLGQGLDLRRALLRHPTPRVREAVLDWYREAWDERDLDELMPLAADPRREVRRALGRVLEAHRPFAALSALRARVGGAGFERLDAELQLDLCVLVGIAGGDRALPLLEPLLDHKLSAFGGSDAATLVQAAAAGVAAVGTVEARQLLKRHAGGLFGPKKNIVSEALKRLESGRPW